MFIWRDWINENNGICLTESSDSSECKERIEVSVKVIDWDYVLIFDYYRKVIMKVD